MNEDFDSQCDSLEELLKRYRPKWQLSALAWIDYDDVCQIIRFHIYKKWHLWDQTRPFKPWASMIISNQIKNLIRNNYTSFAKPCLRCPHNMGATNCGWTQSGEQDVSCPLFSKWKKKKERAFNIKLPLTLEEGVATSTTNLRDFVDYKESSKKLHRLVMEQLNAKHKKIYRLLYIENMEDNEVAERFGFKADSAKRKKPRYKQIANLKKKFYNIALKIIRDNDIV